MPQPPTFFDGAQHFRIDQQVIYSIAGNNNVNVLNVQMDGKPSNHRLFSDRLPMQPIQILSVDSTRSSMHRILEIASDLPQIPNASREPGKSQSIRLWSGRIAAKW
jgi:hypothetical protein